MGIVRPKSIILPVLNTTRKIHTVSVEFPHLGMVAPIFDLLLRFLTLNEWQASYSVGH